MQQVKYKSFEAQNFVFISVGMNPSIFRPSIFILEMSLHTLVPKAAAGTLHTIPVLWTCAPARAVTQVPVGVDIHLHAKELCVGIVGMHHPGGHCLVSYMEGEGTTVSHKVHITVPLSICNTCTYP
jgi:hypothetical protein